ncbi:hypothetical protein JCM18918_1039 [Cutibacterium acnes JCM 18918]|nr:hypothetical protein JCM18918_1039 [Cutibacterium acnes JCM 18918]
MHQDDSSLGVGDDVLAVEELGSQLIGRLEVAGLLVDLLIAGVAAAGWELVPVLARAGVAMVTPVTAMVLATANALSLRGNDIKMLLCVD